MVSGLEEVKQVITSGAIDKKEIRAKPLSSYREPLHSELREIELQVSSILCICHTASKRNQSGFVCLTMKEIDQVDKLKLAIIEKTNEISIRLGISRLILPSSWR